MGHAIADAAAARGHRVTLVTTADLPALPSVKVVRVETAQEMLEAVSGEPADVAVLAAAVADFRPQSSTPSKIPRDAGIPSIELEETPDVLASVMSRPDRPFVVGFAAETGGVERAVEKAKRKGVDLMVYNDVTEPGSGFGSDTNRVVVIHSEGETEPWPMMSKAAVAERLVELIFAELEARE
jgi:phosphopantothenoylcysteine decarboxylase/phosphopantothenate--cysteine ligase